MRILVVDDSSTMRRIVINAVQKLNLGEIVQAENGVDAIMKIKEFAGKIDLILMDINMPKLDGVSTLKELRAARVTMNIPIIMVTSESEAEKVIECIEAGANDYVVKPFTPNVLMEKIKNIMPVPQG